MKRGAETLALGGICLVCLGFPLAYGGSMLYEELTTEVAPATSPLKLEVSRRRLREINVRTTAGRNVSVQEHRSGAPLKEADLNVVPVAEVETIRHGDNSAIPIGPLRRRLTQPQPSEHAED